MRQVSGNVLELGQAEVELEHSGPLDVQVGPESSAMLNLPPSGIHGLIVGILVGFSEVGVPLVTFAGNAEGNPLPARSTVDLSIRQIGHEITLVFEQGEITKPIVLGWIRPQPLAQREPGPEGTFDGEHVVLSAERKIVLRCGKSSITLTRAGKVNIHGTYLLSRSSGVNRIKGGSVQIN
jgi:hypothetical protein